LKNGRNFEKKKNLGGEFYIFSFLFFSFLLSFPSPSALHFSLLPSAPMHAGEPSPPISATVLLHSNPFPIRTRAHDDESSSFGPISSDFAFFLFCWTLGLVEAGALNFCEF